MPDNRRAPRKLLVLALALPIIALVYLTTFGSRLWAALRPGVATFLGVTVIGSVYAGEAAKRAPATPMRAAAALALAVALVVPAAAPAPVAAAGDPVEQVIAAAREYLGFKFKLGTEGPRTFDCSGLIYRVFEDAGELPRVSGMRLRAAGYMRWFMARGLFTRNEAEARRGDLVVYSNGKHIGIYLGDGKVLSALITGMAIHRLHGVNQPVTQFLRINWGRGDGNGDGDGNTNPGDPPKPDKPDKPKPDKPKPEGNPPSSPDNEGVRPDRFNATALGTMNLRLGADPSARIIGWVGRNAEFRIIDRGQSPAGYLWFQVELRNGKQGWVYSRWVSEAGN